MYTNHGYIDHKGSQLPSFPLLDTSHFLACFSSLGPVCSQDHPTVRLRPTSCFVSPSSYIIILQVPSGKLT